jgi:hypothetical protein
MPKRFHIITIHASLPQLRKLRKGHKVRVKKGKGVHVVVDPETFNLVSRSFDKNKGLELKLNDEEIEQNRRLSPEEHKAIKDREKTGGGIFGGWGDRQMERLGIKDAMYHLGDVIKPYAKDAILGGLTAGAAGLGALQPELIPFLAPGVGLASTLANDFLDKPHAYHKDPVNAVSSLAGAEAKSHANKLINQHLGTNYDYMNTAGLQKAGADEINKQISNAEIQARKHIPVNDTSGFGLHRHKKLVMSGGALHHHAHRHKNLIENHTIGTNGGFVTWTPPALVSQPYSANFAMSHMLPPQYAHLNNSVVGHEYLHGSGVSQGGLGYQGRGMAQDDSHYGGHYGGINKSNSYGGAIYEDAKSVLNNGRKHTEGALRNATGEVTHFGRKMMSDINGNGMRRRRRKGHGLGP